MAVHTPSARVPFELEVVDRGPLWTTDWLTDR